MLSIIATIFFSAVLLAAGGVLFASLDEAFGVFRNELRTCDPLTASRRRAVAIKRPVRFVRTTLRAAA